ncbi:SOS response-associated peptidase family protein [Epilithonimonas sp.]|uniref:SOS response-associated peptidase family protein n=1 Tax=Epilithonimonas sp. TaxID=2894511 RepID=UPI0035B4142A
MCYFFNNKNVLDSKSKKELENSDVQISSYVEGFKNPIVPLIVDSHKDHISSGRWGIDPNSKNYTKDPMFGLNARVETLTKLKTFKNHTANRCVLPINGFYDWHHEMQGKKDISIKYYVEYKENPIFYLGCIYNEIAEGLFAFTMVTQNANELMKFVHNKKERMQICLTENQIDAWLSGDKMEDFLYPKLDPNLIAENLEPNKSQPTLF